MDSQEKVSKHIAPHTLEICAMWAVLTRLEEPKQAQLSLIQKLKLYDGKSLPGFTEENVKELREETVREGLEGISPRYIQDKISNALVSEYDYVNPFMVLNELVEAGNTIVVIEHNLDVIKTADWVIDLGPDGGPDGGRIVATGTPEQVAKMKGTHTGRYLKPLVARRRKR